MVLSCTLSLPLRMAGNFGSTLKDAASRHETDLLVLAAPLRWNTWGLAMVPNISVHSTDELVSFLCQPGNHSQIEPATLERRFLSLYNTTIMVHSFTHPSYPSSCRFPAASNIGENAPSPPFVSHDPKLSRETCGTHLCLAEPPVLLLIVAVCQLGVLIFRTIKVSLSCIFRHG